MKKNHFTIHNNEQHSLKDKSYPLNSAHSLLSNLTFNHIKSKGKCGGKAVCGQCRVQIISRGNYCNKPNAEERVHLSEQEIENGWRLACQTYCLRSICIDIPY